MQETKFSQQEIDLIKQLQKDYSELSMALGQLELEKMVIKGREDKLHSVFAELTEREQNILKSLNEKYGVGSLNLDTGTFTPNP